MARNHARGLGTWTYGQSQGIFSSGEFKWCLSAHRPPRLQCPRAHIAHRRPLVLAPPPRPFPPRSMLCCVMGGRKVVGTCFQERGPEENQGLSGSDFRQGVHLATEGERHAL
eukprot:1554320-Rhodomonas_salina.1